MHAGTRETATDAITAAASADPPATVTHATAANERQRPPCMLWN